LKSKRLQLTAEDVAETLIINEHSRDCPFGKTTIQRPQKMKAGDSGGRPTGSVNNITAEVVVDFVLARSKPHGDMYKSGSLGVMARALGWPIDLTSTKDVALSASKILRKRTRSGNELDEDDTLQPSKFIIEHQHQQHQQH
jgi:hypothetical protein